MNVEFKHLVTGDRFLYYGLQYIKCESFGIENTVVDNLGVCIETNCSDTGEAIFFEPDDVVERRI